MKEEIGEEAVKSHWGCMYFTTETNVGHRKRFPAVTHQRKGNSCLCPLGGKNCFGFYFVSDIKCG